MPKTVPVPPRPPPSPSSSVWHQGVQKRGCVPTGTRALAPALQPNPPALGSRCGHLAWLDSGRISPTGGSNTSALMGTTDFTLSDTKHRTFPCPSVPAAAGWAQAAHGGCCGHARPTVTRTWGQGDSWLHPEPRDTAWGSSTTAGGDDGRDELAPCWPCASQVPEVRYSPLQGLVRSRHQPPAPSRVCIGESFQTSPCFLRSRLTPCNTTGFCCFSSSHGVWALGLSFAMLRLYAEPPRALGTAWRRSGFSDTLKAEMRMWKYEVETWPHAGRASLGLPTSLPRHTPSFCSLLAPVG